MVQPEDYVINKNGEVIGKVIAIDSEKDMAKIYRYDLNKNKEDLELPTYIYQKFDSIIVKEQSGGSGILVKVEEGKYDNLFHIINFVPEKGAQPEGLYGYFKDEEIYFEILHSSSGDSNEKISSGDSNEKINYTFLYNIISGIEFQNIIEEKNDIIRQQLASQFIKRIELYNKVIKFALNQNAIADTQISQIKKDTALAVKKKDNDKIRESFQRLKITKSTKKRTLSFLTNL